MKLVTPNMQSPAVFLDRDGTLMRDVDYCGDPNNVHILPGVPEALRKLKDRGFKLIVITNQSGIGRGYFNEEQYREVENELSRQLGEDLLDATYYCPHLPNDKCECRKPSPEMVLTAAREHDIDLAKSFFIGDKPSDLECGRNAGVKTILVKTGYGNETHKLLAKDTDVVAAGPSRTGIVSSGIPHPDQSLADFVAEDLKGAADIILHDKLAKEILGSTGCQPVFSAACRKAFARSNA